MRALQGIDLIETPMRPAVFEPGGRVRVPRGAARGRDLRCRQEVRGDEAPDRRVFDAAVLGGLAEREDVGVDVRDIASGAADGYRRHSST
jgi:hypothetical protein